MGAPRRRGEVTRPGDGCKKVVGVSYRARAHGRGAWGWFGREVAWIPDGPARGVVRLVLGFRDHAAALVFGSIFGDAGGHPMRRDR